MAIKIYQLLTCLLLCLPVDFVSAKKELKLLHVLSVNKFYVPDYSYSSTSFEVPKNLTYDYFVKNAVDIPNGVKMSLFNLGEDLRASYDLFIGPIYMDEVTRMQTTQFPVSIIAGELINAGLWPPVEPQIWKDDLAWQPIPFEYKPVEQDTQLLGTLCPRFEAETDIILKSRNLSKTHSQLFDYLHEKGGINVTSLLEMPQLYFALENSLQMSQSLPEWAKSIYPKDLLNATLTAYDLLSETPTQKRLNGGSFLKSILKTSRDYMAGLVSDDRKINIYSGDDRLFAGLARNLKIPLYDIPESGAALIFELYTENNEYFVKLVYHMGAKNDSLPFALFGCDIFCPIDKFSKLVEEVLPENDVDLCAFDGTDATIISTNLFLASLALTLISAVINVSS